MKTNKTTSTTDAPRVIRNRKPAVTDAATTSAVITPRTMADAIALARTVTPDNFAATLRTANTNHGVTFGDRNKNRFDHTRIEHTQNVLFIDNATNQLTDCQLSFVWCVAFPMAAGRAFDANRAIVDGRDADGIRRAIVDGIRIIGGARASFNAGKHGNTKPAVPSVRYGGRTTFVNTPTVAPAAPAATVAPAAPAKTSGRLVKR